MVRRQRRYAWRGKDKAGNEQIPRPAAVSTPEISQTTHQLMLSQFQADLFKRFSTRSVASLTIAFLAPTARKGHLPRPGIVNTDRTLDKNDLRIICCTRTVQNERYLCLVHRWLVYKRRPVRIETPDDLLDRDHQ
jgi:hypothetical protein